jgi:hypothetical protein
MAVWGKKHFLFLRQTVHVITTGLLRGAVSIKTADGNASNNTLHMRENVILHIITFSVGDMTVTVKTLHSQGNVLLYTSNFSSRYREGNSNQNLIYRDECLFVCVYVWNLYKFTFLNRSEPNFAHVSSLVWKRP